MHQFSKSRDGADKIEVVDTNVQLFGNFNSSKTPKRSMHST